MKLGGWIVLGLATIGAGVVILVVYNHLKSNGCKCTACACHPKCDC